MLVEPLLFKAWCKETEYGQEGNRHGFSSWNLNEENKFDKVTTNRINVMAL